MLKKLPERVSVSKSEFARQMDVHPAQVTRWIDRGMPVRADERLDPGTAVDWVRRNIDRFQREESKKRTYRELVRKMREYDSGPGEVLLHNFSQEQLIRTVVHTTFRLAWCGLSEDEVVEWLGLTAIPSFPDDPPEMWWKHEFRACRRPQRAID
jgi:hypothetical protein